MAEAPAKVTARRRVSRIWLVPIVAVLLGAWMVVYTLSTEGPDVVITFSTAEGIEAGKTKIKARSVEVGLVETVALGEDLESVVVTTKLERSAIPLLREDTQFWVVRARIGAGGVSGLGTVLSGGYIELAPGVGEPGRREFRGLDDPPVTPAGTPGLHLTLVSDEAASVGSGDDILYRGYRVGRIDSQEFDLAAQKVHYSAFIEAPYDDLVTSRTRFWNVSGISFNASADGIEVHTSSLKSLLLGGVAFGLPDGVEPGSPVQTGETFQLFRERNGINERPYHHSVEYVVAFERSVRGLRPGAPVEYRGLHAGHVERILLEELVDRARDLGQRGQPIPVLLRLEPGRMQMGDSEEGAALLRSAIDESVGNGMRATLATGNLLTGRLYVALDMHRDAEPDAIGSFAHWPTIPTIEGGLEAIEQRVAKLLDKLNALPLEGVTESAGDTLRTADETLLELQRTVAELRLLVASEDFQALPGQLDRTLKSVDALADTLEEQPSSVIFPREYVADPEPPAGNR